MFHGFSIETLGSYLAWANYVLIGLTIPGFLLTIGATENAALVDSLRYKGRTRSALTRLLHFFTLTGTFDP